MPIGAHAYMAPASGSAERTGQMQAKRVKRTSLQIEAELANKAAFWLEYKAAHKAATREYAASVEQGMHRRKGRTSVDVATKYSKQLSPDNPHEITDRALTNWVAQGKVPGISPQVPGPKPCKVKRALVNISRDLNRNFGRRRTHQSECAWRVWLVDAHSSWRQPN